RTWIGTWLSSSAFLMRVPVTVTVSSVRACGVSAGASCAAARPENDSSSAAWMARASLAGDGDFIVLSPSVMGRRPPVRGGNAVVTNPHSVHKCRTHDSGLLQQQAARNRNQE